MLKPLILSPELCNFTLKAVDLLQMADLGRQKRDLSADCFEVPSTSSDTRGTATGTLSPPGS